MEIYLVCVQVSVFIYYIKTVMCLTYTVFILFLTQKRTVQQYTLQVLVNRGTCTRLLPLAGELAVRRFSVLIFDMLCDTDVMYVVLWDCSDIDT